MIQIKKFIQKKPLFWCIILVILLSIPAFTSLLQPGYFSMHDDLQIMRIFEMDKCFRDLQIPCRWVPDMGFGYGYPLYNYYPVMPYYLGELIHILGFGLIWSAKILFILSILVSGVTMFLLGRKLWGDLGGLVSSILYVYAPYHAVDIYVRGAMAESWSLAWTPAVFWAIILVVEKTNIKNTLLLASFIALFLTSHNPMALVLTPIMIIWAIVLLINKRSKQAAFKLIIGGLWGLGLASFFTLPVLVEGKLVHLETLFSGYFNYLAHFVSLEQMFISTFWGYGDSVWGSNDGISFQIGWLNWGAVILVTFLALFFLRKDRFKASLMVVLIIFFWLAAFLMHPRANPVWEKLTILQTLQFPWRLLAVTIFTSSLLAGSLLSEKIKKPFSIFFLLALMVAIFVLYRPYFHIQKPLMLTDQEKLTGILWEAQRNSSIFDYLPKTAKAPPGMGAPSLPEVLQGFESAKITNYKVNTDSMSFDIESTESAKIRLPLIDFPDWRVFVDNKEIMFDNKNDLGQPTFELTSGDHNVYAKLYNTPIRTFANLISIISLVALIFLGLRLWKK